MKRAIITGATGAIGMALVSELIDNDVEVLVLCHKESKRTSLIPNHPLVVKKYCDLDELYLLKNDTGKEYDVFFHLAWSGTVGDARDDMYLQNQNVKHSLDAVKMAARFGCKKFVGAGSQAEYGRVEGILTPETATFPETGYGIAKLSAGFMTREYAHQLGLQHVWVRVLSVYGPYDGKQSMVMSTISKLMRGEIPQFTRGEQKWDYLYSGDAARAFYLVGKNGIDGKVYVLGSGETKMLVEYIYLIRDAVNQQAQVEIGAIPYGAKQVMHLQADISQLKEDVGFQPLIPFEEGIKLTI